MSTISRIKRLRGISFQNRFLNEIRKEKKKQQQETNKQTKTHLDYFMVPLARYIEPKKTSDVNLVDLCLRSL